MATLSARIATFLLVVGSVAGLCGCGGGSKEKPVFKVHGKLTFEGKPMSGAEIAFLPADPAQRGLQSRATANANGEYTLYTYRQNDGAPAGEYVVTLYWPAPLSKRAAEKLEKAETVEEKDAIIAPDRLKDVYRDPLKTKLKATVAEKDNEIDFTLP
ncbi:Uncharacterized protein OS=Singulisphaera acidiphila (strain ATCC BAA-1392 / DSM 18658 / VKM B-2454 / MOB10) GN=Sinac_3752 PE=4 SV=1 [Gemmata massiliana]|uniref:Carboxypeptidase regulatory-like domain-containing protein n=1 Tax=Gemmata massiliana TaxID=1210884 RepID=A0A6P2D0X7_9BACT|nr:carboxypeptidase-like regulatory domain-containing protein [Gemmata massiliana]VTR93734.1 Uncharacterized protein OS=Singulisphaera acidiphila (strain ATCC BAA-1392 / DSM 18658 / VKM B-2454 / MOB10) GN=Sinac_3752 PE=4 SV=1 [Gemmata massiliana]